MEIDTKTMHPWHDISRVLLNARSLTVKIGNETYAGEATLESDNGEVTLSFPAKKKRAKK